MYWAIASRIIPYVAVAVLAASSAWVVQGWRADSAIQAMKAAQAQAAATAESQARKKEAELNQARQKVEVEYAKAKRKAAVDLNTAQSELDRLRGTLSARDRQAGSDPTAPCFTYGGAIERELLGACAQSLVALAADTDGLRAQVLALQDYVRGVCR